MQIAMEVRRVLAKRPKEIQLGHFKLRSRKDESSSKETTTQNQPKFTSSPSSTQQEKHIPGMPRRLTREDIIKMRSQAAQAEWMGRMTMGVEEMKGDGERGEEGSEGGMEKGDGGEG
jgi:hypothetical protein